MPLGTMARVPLEPIAGLLLPINTNFKQQFGTYAIDLLLTNLDVANTLTYQINNVSGVAKTLAAGGEIAFNSVIIENIRVVGNAGTGTWEILAFALPREILFG